MIVKQGPASAPPESAEPTLLQKFEKNRNVLRTLAQRRVSVSMNPAMVAGYALLTDSEPRATELAGTVEEPWRSMFVSRAKCT